MSTETVATPDYSAPAEKPAFDSSTLPPVILGVWNSGAEASQQYNDLAATKDAATGDVDKAKRATKVKLPEVSAPTEDLAKMLEQINGAVAKYNAKIDSHYDALTSKIDPAELEQMEAKMSELKNLWTQCRNFVKGQAPKAVEFYPALSTGRGSSSGVGRGAGGFKIRNVEVFIDNVLATSKSKDAEGNEVHKSTITAGALVLGIDAKSLQGLYLSNAGVEDWKKAPAVVEFSVNLNDSGPKNVRVVRTFKQDDSEEAAA